MYVLELNKEQLRVIRIACEFYSRFCSGQWRIPDEMEMREFKLQDKYDGFWDRRNYVEGQFNVLKTMFTGLDLNASYGIGSDSLVEEAKVCYDIYRPILEQFAKEYNSANPESNNHTVYDHPGLTYSKSGRINIKAINE